MTPEEVIKSLNERFGIKASSRNLLHMAERGLIPRPSIGSLGRGKGTYSEYPDDAPERYYAIWRLNKHAKMPLTLQAGFPRWLGESPVSSLSGADLIQNNTGWGPNAMFNIQQTLWLTLYRLAELNVPARSEVSIQIKVFETSNFMIKLPEKEFKPDENLPPPTKIKVLVDRNTSPWPKIIEVLNVATQTWIPLVPDHFPYSKK